MKKRITLLLAAMLAMTAVCGLAAYTPGTFTGEGQGMNGTVKVDVTFSEDAITEITVGENQETPGVSDPAIAQLPDRIVEAQSLAVDTVTGATFTSNGILAAVADAVAQAGGDAEALRKVEVTKAAGEAVEMSAEYIVIGGGGAGLSAAANLGEAGHSVIIVEKGAAYGGNTILAGGYFQAVNPDYFQYAPMSEGQKASVEAAIALPAKNDIMARWQANLRAEYDAYLASGKSTLFDSVYLHMIQTYDGGDYVGDPELIEMMCQGDVQSLDWLTERGFNWRPTTVAIVGSIWQRCKFSADYASGQGFIAIMSKDIEEKNLPVETVFECRAEHLIVEDGKVVGTTAVKSDGTPYTFRAEKAVILASGGFSANIEMRQKYDGIWGNLNENVPTTNAPTITGDGIVMGLEVGAALTGIDQIQLLPTADPVTGHTDNVIGEGTCPYVNQEGKRFVDESSRRDVLAKAILEQTGAYCYIISTFQNSRMDSDYKNNYFLYLDDLIASGAVQKGDTLEELAEQIGVPVDTFVETCQNFNKYVEASNDPETGRVNFSGNSALEMEGPFYACKRAPAVHHTMGGLKVNTKNQVLNESGEVIPGFYAAGEVTGGFHGSNRLGGNAVAEVVTTGRNAAMNAMAE